MVIDLVGLLVAGHGDLFGVDDDNAIAAIDMGRERGLVLAAKDLGANGRQPAEDNILGIDDVPFHLNIRRLGGNGFHIKRSRQVYRYRCIGQKQQRPQIRARRRRNMTGFESLSIDINPKKPIDYKAL